MKVFKYLIMPIVVGLITGIILEVLKAEDWQWWFAMSLIITMAWTVYPINQWILKNKK